MEGPVKQLSNTDTICAQATPPGAGGLGVVRISGPAAFAILKRIWRGRVDPSEFKTRKLYLGEVFKADFPNLECRALSPEFVDRVFAVKMPAPHTYTGQDVVELSCHGSQIVLSKIVQACVAAGARVASPGEFTRRAFLSGKMDLAQAEAVCDLISATSERGARLAADQLEGKLSKEINEIKSNLAEIRGFVEAWIDFPEEEIEDLEEGVEKRIEKIAQHVESLASTYESGKLIREGIRVAIVGRPNAGKSSILNCLAGCERALVHHEPGTTRDVIEQCASFEGVMFRFRDTAGMRHKPTEVEAMGINRACSEIEKADLTLVVFDGAQPFGEEDVEVLKRVGTLPTVLIINKNDLVQQFDDSKIGDHIRVSAKTGEGIDRLVQLLVSHVISSASAFSMTEGVAITSARHKEALAGAGGALKKAQSAYKEQKPLECIAQLLRIAQESLGAITGEVTTEDLLDRIFSKFCIGK